MEDQVRVLLGHGAHLGDVVPHHHVEQCEVRRRPVRQVAHGQAGRLAAVLVYLRGGGGAEGAEGRQKASRRRYSAGGDR